MSITEQQLKQILEAAIMASNEPISIEKMLELFVEEKEPPARDAIKEALGLIETECEARGVELKKVSSGYRFQAKKDYSPWVSRLWEEKPARYSRALLETLVLIAYKQPITRGEIEHVRGVAVSTNIIKTLLEREWVRVVGHRDVPGKPALYATTKAFLDYFNLTSLEELPTLAEIRDLDKINPELELQEPGSEQEQEEATGESVTAEEMQQQVAEAVGEEVTDEIEPETETTGEQAESVEALEEDIDTNQDDRDDVMLDEHDKEMESRLVAEEEELIAATESAEAEDVYVVAESETDEISPDEFSTSEQLESSSDDEIVMDEVIESQLVAEEEGLDSITESTDTNDDNITAEFESMTDEASQDELSKTEQPEQSMDDDIVDETVSEEEKALEATTVDSDEYSDSDELDSKFGS
ncbi:SMC-Scp complex subunit ScpB [Kaarinaea lacus]